MPLPGRLGWSYLRIAISTLPQLKEKLVRANMVDAIMEGGWVGTAVATKGGAESIVQINGQMYVTLKKNTFIGLTQRYHISFFKKNI